MKGLKNKFYPTKFLIVQTSVPNTEGNFSSQDLAGSSNYTAKRLDSSLTIRNSILIYHNIY